MVFVTSIISSQEWIRLSEAAQQAFPNEVLARGEIMRRFSLSGVAALKAASDAEKKKVQQHHQATMCVAGPEGDKPRGQVGINLSGGGGYAGQTAAGCGALDACAGTAHGADGRVLVASPSAAAARRCCSIVHAGAGPADGADC
jgi:hypothetical protein